jgi:hypothetical protein
VRESEIKRKRRIGNEKGEEREAVDEEKYKFKKI